MTIVFNTFCLYGNVTAVVILKDGQVLVELNDVDAAERCVSALVAAGSEERIKSQVSDEFSKVQIITASRFQTALDLNAHTEPCISIITNSQLN